MDEESSKITRLEIVLDILNQVAQKIRTHDYASAQVMVGVTLQVLEDLQLDLELHSQVERQLRKMLYNQ